MNKGIVARRAAALAKWRAERKALIATVLDLWLHCTDVEIARFMHSTYNEVRTIRRRFKLGKYASDIYMRPGR